MHGRTLRYIHKKYFHKALDKDTARRLKPSQKQTRRVGRVGRGLYMKLKVMEYKGDMVLAVAGTRQTLIIREEEGGFTFEVLAEGRHVAVPVFTMECAREESTPVNAPMVATEHVQEEAPPPSEAAPKEEETPDNGLFQRLAVLRKEFAVADAVPPYMIFHNKTLQAMVEAMPRDMRAFGAISGVGQAKRDKYGPAFLAVINGYVAPPETGNNPRMETTAQ